MINICHLTSVHKRYDTRIFQKQCIALAKENIKVVLLCVDEFENEIINKVQIKSISIKHRNAIGRILKAQSKLYCAALEIDAVIYHIHDPELIPLGLKLKRKGKKVIYDSHEDLPRQILEKQWIPKLFRKALSIISEIYLKKTLPNFDAVLTVSPHIADNIRKITNNVSVVTNYPILENDYIDFSYDEYCMRRNQVVYSGTVYTYSQQEFILKALEKVDNVNYCMVGVIEEHYKNKLSNYSGWLKTTFIDKVPKIDLLNIYNESTIGIVIFDYTPNVGFKQGTLGNNKIFEYMLAGLPIICTDFVVWREIVDKYNCGIYVNAHSIKEISNALNYLFENKQIAYEMGQNGRKAVIQEYNWGSQEKKLVEVYNRIVN